MKCSVDRNVAHQFYMLEVKIRLDFCLRFSVLPVLGQLSGYANVTGSGKYIKIM